MDTQQKTKNLLEQHGNLNYVKYYEVDFWGKRTYREGLFINFNSADLSKPDLGGNRIKVIKIKSIPKWRLRKTDKIPNEFTFKCRRCYAEIKIIRSAFESWNDNPEKDMWVCDSCGAARMILLITANIDGKIKVVERNRFLPEELPIIDKIYSFNEEDLDKIYKMMRDYHSATFPFEIRNDPVFIYGIKDALEKKLDKTVIVNEAKNEWVIR